MQPTPTVPKVLPEQQTGSALLREVLIRIKGSDNTADSPFSTRANADDANRSALKANGNVDTGNDDPKEAEKGSNGGVAGRLDIITALHGTGATMSATPHSKESKGLTRCCIDWQGGPGRQQGWREWKRRGLWSAF